LLNFFPGHAIEAFLCRSMYRLLQMEVYLSCSSAGGRDDEGWIPKLYVPFLLDDENGFAHGNDWLTLRRRL
jgi:hypothetical protein